MILQGFQTSLPLHRTKLNALLWLASWPCLQTPHGLGCPLSHLHYVSVLCCRVTNHCESSSQFCSLGRAPQMRLGLLHMVSLRGTCDCIQLKAWWGTSVLLHVASSTGSLSSPGGLARPSLQHGCWLPKQQNQKLLSFLRLSLELA